MGPGVEIATTTKSFPEPFILKPVGAVKRGLLGRNWIFSAILKAIKNIYFDYEQGIAVSWPGHELLKFCFELKFWILEKQVFVTVTDGWCKYLRRKEMNSVEIVPCVSSLKLLLFYFCNIARNN